MKDVNAYHEGFDFMNFFICCYFVALNLFMKTQLQHYEDKLTFEMDPSDLFEAINNGENVIVVDARKPFGYEAEHIPTAINLPHREMTRETTKHLDTSATYIVYCDGIGCNASTKGALNMTR